MRSGPLSMALGALALVGRGLAMILAREDRFPAEPPPPGPPDREPIGADGRRLLALHNAERAARGLPPLAWDDRLAAAALDQAAWCASVGHLTHVGPAGQTVVDRARRRRWPGSSLGENANMQEPAPPGWTAPDPRTPDWAFEGWMRSPGHRSNILGPWTHLGTARVDAPSGRRYRVAVFGRA